ncbi:MAG TPA: aldo/keto reductase [Thermodesulfobacteriota bacterium]|nr:aldo/keto reductase [Thermodesulfobacteriota bacterium]
MLYRKLGKTGLDVSNLGFGCMRLPIQGGSQSHLDGFDPNKKIDEEEATQMVEYAIEKGVNYFDTAYIYHAGQSETFLGKALKKYRSQIILVTKLPVMLLKKREDSDRFLEKQLKRLDTDHLDVYLLHGLGRRSWGMVKELGVLEFLDRIQKDGRTRYVGFSFHDDVKIFKEIVDSYHWMMCQIQYNYFDENRQAGKEGLTYAASKGLGIAIMEPIRGGKLADPVPEEVQALWNSAKKKRTPAEWALRWVWNHPEVSTALSGMSEMSQVEENVRIANEGKPRSLTKKDLSTIDQVKKTYEKMLKIDCTGCAYCMPCESGVNIPTNLSLYNDMFMFKDPELNVMMYNMMLSPEARASNCTECGNCEERCPQHLQIMDTLKMVHETLYRPQPTAEKTEK